MSFLIGSLYLVSLIVLADDEISMRSASRKVSESLKIIASTEAQDAVKLRETKAIRSILTSAMEGKTPPISLDSALAFRALPYLVSIMKENIEDDAYVVLTSLQASCLRPRKADWVEWLGEHRSEGTIEWAWPQSVDAP